MINIWPWSRIKALETQVAKHTEDLRQAKITDQTIAGLLARLRGLELQPKINNLGTFQTSQPVSFNELPVKVGAIPKRTVQGQGGAKLIIKGTADDGAEAALMRLLLKGVRNDC